MLDYVYPKKIVKVIKLMYFKKIRESNIHKIMASLDDHKIRFEPCLLAICPYNFISYDPENLSKFNKDLSVVIMML